MSTTPELYPDAAPAAGAVTDYAPDPSVAPRTLRSLFGLRIFLCVAAGGLALVKVFLSPPLSATFSGALTDTYPGLDPLLRALNLLVSGSLAVILALVLTTLLTQARLQAYLARENRELPGA